MLTSLSITNFKCYAEKTTFELGKINLLTGINGKGKSTFLQVLLLFRQSIEHNPNSTKLLLNGSYVRLGAAGNVKNVNVRNDEFIEFGFEQKPYEAGNTLYPNRRFSRVYQFQADKESSRYLNLEKLTLELTGGETNSQDSKNPYEFVVTSPHTHENRFFAPIKEFRPDSQNSNFFSTAGDKEGEIFLTLSANFIPQGWGGTSKEGAFFRLTSRFDKIHYVAADRLGPQEFYTKGNFGNFVHVGKQGELVADVLSYTKEEGRTVEPTLCRSKNTDVLSQAGEWLGYILDNENLSIVLNDENEYSNSIAFKMDNGVFTPPNVGFGYSYTLPIIVAGLLAKLGEILIIENPEAHLHPRAQSRLAQFLAKVASTDVQVFVESHSDHILNGLRVEVKHKMISSDDIKVFFFANGAESPTTPYIFTPIIDEDGRIEEWPDGFFDEWNNNLIELL